MEIGKAIELLYGKLSEERRTGELLVLPSNFYATIQENINSGSTEEIKDNYNKLLNNLKTKRIQKLLIYLAYGRQPPKPIPLEEEALFVDIKRLLEKKEPMQGVHIRISADVPEIITSNGNKLGPYKKNEIITVQDDADIQFILKNNIGETTN
ncbi:MAG: hypothetical protein M1156_02010 [Candidatus Marsarchaeota archaeon]|jgi:hypothetical protein|nr:hypothetical protein [Candidatus Marsarchaeota archaeon]